MSQPYLGEIEIFSFGFAPKYWAQCNGQLMAIQQNQALFALLGTTFGGDGHRTFALPDLRGRIPIGQGHGAGLTPRVIGETAGETQHTLLSFETPSHVHSLNANANPTAGSNTSVPGPTVVLATTAGVDKHNQPLTINLYAADSAPNQAMAPAAIGPVGGMPHNNIMPNLAVNFCIALVGIFPSRN
jgi:microcystin-dependent protein